MISASASAVHWLQALVGQQAQPGAAVRAAVLSDPGPGREQARRGHPGYGVDRLGDECGRLGAPGLLRHGRVVEQLR